LQIRSPTKSLQNWLEIHTSDSLDAKDEAVSWLEVKLLMKPLVRLQVKL
jgi:hypothetical protein